MTCKARRLQLFAPQVLAKLGARRESRGKLYLYLVHLQLPVGANCVMVEVGMRAVTVDVNVRLVLAGLVSAALCLFVWSHVGLPPVGEGPDLGEGGGNSESAH